MTGTVQGDNSCAKAKGIQQNGKRDKETREAINGLPNKCEGNRTIPEMTRAKNFERLDKMRAVTLLVRRDFGDFGPLNADPTHQPLLVEDISVDTLLQRCR